MTLRVVMMGTGRFALPTLGGLYASPHNVVALCTQPDREGRGHHRHANPLKELAMARGTPVFQPQRVRTAEALDTLRSLQPELCVVAAYGQILPASLLAIPRYGAVNVHASILPKYRGAAPVHYAILNGEAETGITIFQIDAGLDAGPILAVERTPIHPKETTGDLEARLAELAVPLILRVVDAIEAGAVEPRMQDPAEATRAPRLSKNDGAIDWTQGAIQIERHVRAMQPWPAPFTYLVQPNRPPLRLIVLDVDPAEFTVDVADRQPGTVVSVDAQTLRVAAGNGAVDIRRLKPEGKREMHAEEFLRGYPVTVGDRLTSAV